MGNSFALLALLAWPVLCVFVFRSMKTHIAVFVTIVGGFMLLPVGVEIDFPLVPPFDKNTIPTITAFLGCLLIKKHRIRLLPSQPLVAGLCVLLVITPLVTTLLNREPMVTSAGFIAGLTLKDAVSFMIGQYLMVLPLIIACQVVRSPGDLRDILWLLTLAAVAYVPLILLEIRLSPQLHSWVYGFFPHSFAQQVRFGGFRSVVFMGHGLLVAFFIACACVAAQGLGRSGFSRISQDRAVLPLPAVTLGLFVVLVLCKSVGAVLLAVMGLALLTIVPLAIATRLVWTLALVAFSYPVLSLLGWIPKDELVAWGMSLSADRAQSLGFRFFHENAILAHANQKWLFGWGGWGRWRLSDSVSDGTWIIQYGQWGAVGFVAYFGLVLVSIRSSLNRAKSRLLSSADRYVLFTGALIAVILLVDQVPNSSMSGAWAWLVVGAVLGAGVPGRAGAPSMKHGYVKTNDAGQGAAVLRGARELPAVR